MTYRILYLLILILFSGCTTKSQIIAEEQTIHSPEITELLTTINKMNQNIPENFRANVSVNAIVNKNNYNVQGRAYFINSPRKIRLKLNDLIFKSPMIELSLLNKILKVYTPSDETLYIRNTQKLKNTNILENNIEFITTAAIGKIPLISNYKVNKIITKSKKQKLLLLENSYYYQTISFRKGLPNKILIVKKKSRQKLEIYFYKPHTVKNYKFFRKIKAFSNRSRNKFTINFYNIKVNTKINHKVFKLRTPGNVKLK